MDSPARILVVDDDPDFLASTRIMLQDESYRVAVAPGEDEALSEMAVEKPDLLILDLIMSKLDSGFQFMWTVKRDERFKDIPILMVTSVDRLLRTDFERRSDSPGLTTEEAYLPVEQYLVKPVKATELVSSVESILARVEKRAVTE